MKTNILLTINNVNKLNQKIMKKIVFTLLMLLTLSLSAQNDGVIKFMGIPVDGSKSDMILKLKQKGFTYDYENDIFSGKFDGESISGMIQTYNDKVYNIRFTHDVTGFNKSVVIHKFNLFVSKYNFNEKYMSCIEFDKATKGIDTYQIDDYEDINYEMKKGKVYRAQYYYKYEKDLSDTTGYYQYKIETITKFSDLARSQGVNIDDYINEDTLQALFFMHRLEQDLVQFYIIEGMNYNTFLIMFDYYNRRNAPNGEDL